MWVAMERLLWCYYNAQIEYHWDITFCHHLVSFWFRTKSFLLDTLMHGYIMIIELPLCIILCQSMHQWSMGTSRIIMWCLALNFCSADKDKFFYHVYILPKTAHYNTSYWQFKLHWLYTLFVPYQNHSTKFLLLAFFDIRVLLGRMYWHICELIYSILVLKIRWWACIVLPVNSYIIYSYIHYLENHIKINCVYCKTYVA